jgi:hypothetical protein
MMNLLQLIAVVILFAACGEGGGPPSIAPRLDSNTNWLRYCSSDIPCGELSCACSICTLPCDPDACAALGPTARCARAEEVALLAPSCGTAGITTSLCVAGCESDEDCEAGRACLLGNCIERIAGGEMAAAASGSGDGSATAADLDPCYLECRLMANEAAQRCLGGADASDDACMTMASEALEDCATGCVVGAPAASGSSPSTPGLPYAAYRCSGELVIVGTTESADEALSNCQLNDLYNRQFGGLRCMSGGELIYDTCPGAAEGSAEASPAAPVETTGAENCYADCRSLANAVIDACRSYGYGDDLCVASGQAQFDSCWERCPAPAAPPLAGQP